MATRTPTKRPTKAPVTAESAPFEPVRIGRKARPTDDGIVLFYLDDQPYRIPARISQGMTLEYLRLARTLGESAAAQRILERLLGPEAYEALEQSDDVREEEMDQILRAVTHHIAGPEDSGKDQA
ncbi:hypothetical protein ACGFZP_13275 [Kitasatospora sp. NPDC048239]|uniref:hypothetical protein n=1 Tax=Kitasatospora sp. NPDC048239 TaxID=3364046 RepID=UPI00371ACE60